MGADEILGEVEKLREVDILEEVVIEGLVVEGLELEYDDELLDEEYELFDVEDEEELLEEE